MKFSILRRKDFPENYAKWWFSKSSKMEESLPFSCLNSDKFVFSEALILMDDHYLRNEFIFFLEFSWNHEYFGSLAKFIQGGQSRGLSDGVHGLYEPVIGHHR